MSGARSADVIKELSKYRVSCAIGSSGTIENLARIAFVYLHRTAHESYEKLEFEDLKKIVRAMCALPLEERRNFPGYQCPESGYYNLRGCNYRDFYGGTGALGN